MRAIEFLGKRARDDELVERELRAIARLHADILIIEDRGFRERTGRRRLEPEAATMQIAHSGQCAKDEQMIGRDRRAHIGRGDAGVAVLDERHVRQRRPASHLDREPEAALPGRVALRAHDERLRERYRRPPRRALRAPPRRSQ